MILRKTSRKPVSTLERLRFAWLPVLCIDENDDAVWVWLETVRSRRFHGLKARWEHYRCDEHAQRNWVKPFPAWFVKLVNDTALAGAAVRREKESQRK